MQSRPGILPSLGHEPRLGLERQQQLVQREHALVRSQGGRQRHRAAHKLCTRHAPPSLQRRGQVTTSCRARTRSGMFTVGTARFKNSGERPYSGLDSSLMFCFQLGSCRTDTGTNHSNHYHPKGVTNSCVWLHAAAGATHELFTDVRCDPFPNVAAPLIQLTDRDIHGVREVRDDTARVKRVCIVPASQTRQQNGDTGVGVQADGQRRALHGMPMTQRNTSAIASQNKQTLPQQ